MFENNRPSVNRPSAIADALSSALETSNRLRAWHNADRDVQAASSRLRLAQMRAARLRREEARIDSQLDELAHYEEEMLVQLDVALMSQLPREHMRVGIDLLLGMVQMTHTLTHAVSDACDAQLAAEEDVLTADDQLREARRVRDALE